MNYEPTTYRTWFTKHLSVTFIVTHIEIAPFIARDLVSLVNKEFALKREVATPEAIRDRAFEIGSKALKLFGCLDNDDYRAVLLKEIQACSQRD